MSLLPSILSMLECLKLIAKIQACYGVNDCYLNTAAVLTRISQSSMDAGSTYTKEQNGTLLISVTET